MGSDVAEAQIDDLSDAEIALPGGHATTFPLGPANGPPPRHADAAWAAQMHVTMACWGNSADRRLGHTVSRPPQPNLPAAGGDDLAVRAERQGEDGTCSAERTDLGPGGDAPQPERLIVAAGSE